MHGSRLERFTPGDVVADRYRMITVIGRGGMGEVWRAHDLVLDTFVALKLLDSSQPSQREQVLNEARIARQITHPAVCRVFDVGEIEGEAFLSMELIEGEDLASLLRHTGRLPAEKVVDIAHQLCGGLAAAHAKGVLHRDLKPANVLIDDAGQVRITDFGIAIPNTGVTDSRLIGTPHYMAPEVLTRGTSTQQSDIFALGVVLFELLTGRHPFEGSDGSVAVTRRPLSASRLIHGVDSRLDRTLSSAIAIDPARRPTSATAMAAMLPPPGPALMSAAPRVPAAKHAVVAALTAVLVIVAAAVGARYVFEAPPRPLTDKDTIILADVVNTTRDPVFDGTMKQALAVALEQSPFLQVVSNERIQDTLRLMGRDADSGLTADTAREVAQREAFTAVVSGAIAPLGANYVISLQALNAQSGEVIARLQVEAAGKERVLSSLGTVASRLREELGESLPSIARFNAPLERATTSSLEALKAYTTAMEQLRPGPTIDAVPQLRRAIELDGNFALAYAQLSSVYANTRQPGLAPPLSEKAFSLRDRVSERERFLISWRYYRDALQNWDKALELARAWTTAYPREAAALNSFGLANLELGRIHEAVAAFNQATTIDAGFLTPYLNLGTALTTLGQFDAAKVPLEYASAHGPQGPILLRYQYQIAFVQNDEATMQDLEARVAGTIEEYAAFSWRGRREAFLGQNSAAHATYREAVRRATARGLNGPAAQMESEDAEIHAIAGECRDARSESASALALSRDNFTLERVSRLLAWCGDRTAAAALTRELMTRFPEATQTLRRWLPITNAVVALRGDDPARAITALADVDDLAIAAQFWPAYIRGLAYQRLDQNANARAQFQSIIDNRGQYVFSPLYALAYVGLAQLAGADGDASQAAAAYDRALAIWKDADPTLPHVASARRERGRLAVGS